MLNGVVKMIGYFLEKVVIGLNKFLKSKIGQQATVNLQRPYGEKGNQPTECVTLTMLNIEEELTLRDPSYYAEPVPQDYSSDKGPDFYKVLRPPIYVHLQVMFVANYMNDYRTELNIMYWIMVYFHMNRDFDLTEVESYDGSKKVTFELNTQPLSEINHLWDNFDGKSPPFVIYRIKMLTVKDEWRETGTPDCPAGLKDTVIQRDKVDISVK